MINHRFTSKYHLTLKTWYAPDPWDIHHPCHEQFQQYENGHADRMARRNALSKRPSCGKKPYAQNM